MSMSKPTPRIAQEPSPRQHTRDLFAWLDQVALDRNLPSSAFKVAYVIAEHVNRASGDAWPSTERIGQGCALKQSTVVDLVRRLHAAGHLAIEPGRAGRGHSHRYRLIQKHRGADISRKAKTSGSPAENIGIAEIKHRGADMNLLKNHLENNLERAYGPRSADVDRVDLTEPEPRQATSAAK